jgi:hypothetical protein
LHVTTTDPITHQQLADVVLGEVDAQIDCSGGAPPTGGFGTGGGWVRSNDGVHKANFGVVGGTQNDGSYRGHVTYKDEGTGFKMQSASITSAQSTGCTTQIIGTWNNAGTILSFTLSITDGGEPGAGNDTFQLDATIYANNNQTLEGGNIQSHPNCQ